MSVPARKRPTSPSSAPILMSTHSSSARARGSDARRVVCQPVQYISFDPLWHRCAGRAWHRCRRGPSAGIAHGLDYLADRLDHQFRPVLLQKVIPFQNRDEARVEHLSLFLLQLLPQVLECRIGWSARMMTKVSLRSGAGSSASPAAGRSGGMPSTSTSPTTSLGY